MKKNVLSFLFLVLLQFSLIAQENFTNPILRGGHPDPSICRVGNDFYIVNSSFEYFPALPIHHSTDLVNWELVGYGLDRASQVFSPVNLVDVQQQGGIHAPSIRYHKGLFYIVVTNVYSPKDPSKETEMVNFIITAEDPSGPWSDPHVIANAPGIDPDIFFDEDGSVWFVGTHDVGDPNKNGIGEIWVQELDLNSWELKGERFSVWAGACGGCCVEGPHIYKRDGMYYLMVAEGGTSRNHSVMMAISDNIRGPYQSNPKNPILTSRHLSNNNWVHSTGHADLVELQDGRWYMVALGIRNDLMGTSNMGRESHLIPVNWETAVSGWEEVEDGLWQPIEYYWPVCAPDTGKVERNAPLPFASSSQIYSDVFYDTFESEKLDLAWNFRRFPTNVFFKLLPSKSKLRLYLNSAKFALRESYNLMGFRQKESDFSYEAKMSFNPKNNLSEAGISIFQQDDNYLNFTLVLEETQPKIVLNYQESGKEVSVLLKKEVKGYSGEIIFQIISKNDRYQYAYSFDNGQSFQEFYASDASLVLCKGYIGTNLGVYATSASETTYDFVDFDWVKYNGAIRKN